MSSTEFQPKTQRSAIIAGSQPESPRRWLSARIVLAIAMLFACSIVPLPADAEGSRQKAEVIVPEAAESWYERLGFAPAVKIDNVIYVSGVVFSLEGEGTYEERYARGFKRALERIGEVLTEAGASLDDIINMTTFHTDLPRQLDAAVEARKAVLRPPHATWTAVGTTSLATSTGVTEIKVIAHVKQ